MAVEVGAVALLASGWLRTLACMGLIAFHVGVFAVTTNILFFSAFMFLFVVGWRVHPLERLAIRWLGSEAPLETSESAEQEPSVSSRPLVVAAFVGGLAVLVVWLTPLTVLQGARGDGVRRTVALESDTPVVQLHRRLEPGSLAQGWRLRHRSQLRDGAFSIWLQPPGEQRDAVPVILADPRVPVPSCEQEGQTAEGVRVCVTEVDTPLEALLPLLRP